MSFNLEKEILKYSPCCEQEKADKELILNLLKKEENLLNRDNKICHFTASSWIVNKEKTKILMIHHNIYNSWSWTGGHADGEEDLLDVSVREAQEETGLKNINILFKDIFSIEILTVNGHIKNGKYISAHLHLNLTFLLEADENDLLFIKPDENSGVKWFKLEDSINISNEDNMKIIYKKLNNKLNSIY
ncbi:NUDIX hydrolase [Candidatus Cetobacterium colombiensis]|jgi:8-oxo-dGTP pyrophosphatase MutT (NUDIX family)|uniref:NUDIX hydrolase n=1 Tax=Candidatus Cetobacterium colombiensis TaxID=3073100 RepID=A0ABU4WCG2_9FUSO|nr:NUDIX hydrolase [Candidatus Cetobacterium colombiensis]MDX8336188.1 NUDIX hydrolase [Candidatus Cetobacterium colombiensis]